MAPKLVGNDEVAKLFFGIMTLGLGTRRNIYFLGQNP